MTPDEHSRLIAEYQRKWRQESLEWTAFEAFLESGTEWIEIMDAALVTANEVSAVHLEGYAWRDSRWHDVWIRAERFAIARSDGEPFDLAALERINTEYWDKFAESDAAMEAEKAK